MLGELFTIPFINHHVNTYGTLFILGSLAGVYVSYRLAAQGNKYQNDMIDFVFWGLLGVLVGSRVLFIIVEYNYYFVKMPWTEIPSLHISIPTVLAIWKGGYVYWGGVIGGIIALVIFCKKRNIPFAVMVDFATVGTALGHSFGRIGCLAGGCCYGYATYHLDQAGKVIADTPFALAFPPGSNAYDTLYSKANGETLALMDKLHTTLPLFPVQILESLGNIVLFFILLLLIPYKRVHGQIALTYLILYPIMRGFTETFRGDAERGFVFENLLSTSQFISLVISLIALVLITYLNLNNRKLSPNNNFK